MADVLIVDDQPDTRQLLRRLFKHAGCDSACVASGVDALEYLQKDHPKVVVLDLMMPDLDGLEVLQRIRSNPMLSDLRVIMYSACSDGIYKDEAFNKGASDFWIKSITPVQQMTEQVRRCVS